MGNFNGFRQNDDRRIVDSAGDELAIGAGGEITAIISGEVEVSNDVGNPLPVTGTVSTTPADLAPITGSYEQITISGTATGLTPPVNADVAIIQNQSGGNGVRWRDDGTSPTSGNGMILAGGTQFEYNGDLSAIEFINIGGGSDTLGVAYYEYV